MVEKWSKNGGQKCIKKRPRFDPKNGPKMALFGVQNRLFWVPDPSRTLGTPKIDFFDPQKWPFALAIFDFRGPKWGHFGPWTTIFPGGGPGKSKNGHFSYGKSIPFLKNRKKRLLNKGHFGTCRNATGGHFGPQKWSKSTPPQKGGSFWTQKVVQNGVIFDHFFGPHFWSKKWSFFDQKRSKTGSKWRPPFQIDLCGKNFMIFIRVSTFFVWKK